MRTLIVNKDAQQPVILSAYTTAMDHNSNGSAAHLPDKAKRILVRSRSIKTVDLCNAHGHKVQVGTGRGVDKLGIGCIRLVHTLGSCRQVEVRHQPQRAICRGQQWHLEHRIERRSAMQCRQLSHEQYRLHPHPMLPTSKKDQGLPHGHLGQTVKQPEKHSRRTQPPEHKREHTGVCKLPYDARGTVTVGLEGQSSRWKSAAMVDTYRAGEERCQERTCTTAPLCATCLPLLLPWARHQARCQARICKCHPPVWGQAM